MFCPQCKKEVDLTPQVHLLEWCEEQYDLALTELIKNHPKQSIKIVCKAIDIFHR